MFFSQSFQQLHLSREWLGRHLLFWAAYFGVIPYQVYVYGLTSEYRLLIAVEWFPFIALIIYSFLYILIPFLLAGRNRQFLAGSLIWLFILWGGSYLYHYSVMLPLQASGPLTAYTEVDYPDTYSMVIMVIFGSVTCVAASLKLWHHWYKKEKISQQLSTEAIVAELELLKAQIHPHFLFNTLNNLYALTLKQSDTAPEVVRMLSALMHYMLHECNSATVPLPREIQTIQSYIELEKLRYGQRLLIDVDVQGDLSAWTIPPLLLMPFVENAFKHGSSGQTDQAYIHVKIYVIEHTLYFNIINSKSELVAKAKTVGGLGLVNVRKRLGLLYPNQYELQLQAEKSSYDVMLTVPLYKSIVSNSSKQPVFH